MAAPLNSLNCLYLREFAVTAYRGGKPEILGCPSNWIALHESAQAGPLLGVIQYAAITRTSLAKMSECAREGSHAFFMGPSYCQHFRHRLPLGEDPAVGQSLQSEAQDLCSSINKVAYYIPPSCVVLMVVYTTMDYNTVIAYSHGARHTVVDFFVLGAPSGVVPATPKCPVTPWSVEVQGVSARPVIRRPKLPRSLGLISTVGITDANPEKPDKWRPMWGTEVSNKKRCVTCLSVENLAGSYKQFSLPSLEHSRRYRKLGSCISKPTPISPEVYLDRYEHMLKPGDSSEYSNCSLWCLPKAHSVGILERDAPILGEFNSLGDGGGLDSIQTRSVFDIGWAGLRNFWLSAVICSLGLSSPRGEHSFGHSGRSLPGWKESPDCSENGISGWSGTSSQLGDHTPGGPNVPPPDQEMVSGGDKASITPLVGPFGGSITQSPIRQGGVCNPKLLVGSCHVTHPTE